MGSCFSKNTTTSTPTLTTTSQQFDLKSNPPQPHNEQQLIKKEIFVIKHRISHEIDKPPNEGHPNLLNPNAVAGNGGGARVRASSCGKEEVDAILIQCGRLSRSNSAGAQNPSRRRRYSRSKRSFDFDLNMSLKNDDVDNDNVDIDNDDDDDEALNHRRRCRRNRRQDSRVSSPSSRRSSRERRISISPSRRSESPICRNSNGGAATAAALAVAANGGGGTRPMKMVPVPATDKSNNAGGNTCGEQAVGSGVKRIHVKRNVTPPRSRSPARTKFRVFSDDQSQERWRNEIDTRVAEHSPYKRKSLAEIDNNAARSVQPKMVAMVENLKLHENQESISDPSPPSYASLLLEDINNFHRKNTNSAATSAATAPTQPFLLPACVSKACSIMEAVADLNSTTTTTTTSSSLFSEERWRNPSPIERYINKDRFIECETVVNGGLTEPSRHVAVNRGGCAATEKQESSDGSSISGSQHLNRKSPNSADPTSRKCETNPLRDYQSKLVDYPRKGIGGGRKTAYSTPKTTTVAST